MRELDRMEPMRPLDAPHTLAMDPSHRQPSPAAPAKEAAAATSDAFTAAAATADATATAAASATCLQVNPGSPSASSSPPRVSTPSALALLAAAAAPTPASNHHTTRTTSLAAGSTAAAAAAPPHPSTAASSAARKEDDAGAEAELGGAEEAIEDEDPNESEPGSMVLHADSDEELSGVRGREDEGEGSAAEREHENEDEDDDDADGEEEEEEENSVIMNADRPDLDLAPDTPPRATHTDSDGEGEEGGRYGGGRGLHRPLSSSLSPPPAVGALSRPGSARRSRMPINGERPRVSFAGLDSGSRASVSISSGNAAAPAPSRSPRSANGMNRGADARQGSFSALTLPSSATAAAGPGGTSPSLSSSSLSPSEQGSGGGGGGGGRSNGSFSLRSPGAQTRAELLTSFGVRGGPLTIVLLGARNLRLQPAPAAGPGAGDDSAAPRGLPDPYISLTATWAPRKKYKSSVQKQSSHPMFNQKFTLQVPPAPAGALAAAVQAVSQAQAAAQQQQQQQQHPIHSTNGPASIASVSDLDDSTMSFSLSTRDSTLFSAALRNAVAATAAGAGSTGSAAPSPSSAAAAALCAASSWGRAVRFRVYHKQLVGKRLLGEVLLDLQALLALAAMQRDVWVPLRGKGESQIGADNVAATVASGGKEATAVPQPQRLSVQRRSVSQPLDSSSLPPHLSAPPHLPLVDRGDLHLIVTVDPLSFAAMLQGLASTSGAHSRMPQDSPHIVSRSSAGPGTATRAQEGERETILHMQLPPPAASTSAAAAAAADAVTRHLHGSTTGELAQRTLLRRRSRSDAGLSASSASAAAAATAAEAEDGSSGVRSTSDDKAALGQPSLSGPTRRVGPSAAEQARHPSPSGSPNLTPSSSSRRAISMDLSSPADLLSRRRSLLAPVLAGDTPEHSATSTPRGAGLAASASAGLNSSESSLMMLHQSMDSVFTTPQKKARGDEGGSGGGGGGGGAGSVAGGMSPGLSAIRPLGSAGSVGGGSASKLLLSAGSVSSATSPAEHPSRSPSRSPAHYRSNSLQSVTPRGSALEGVDEGAGGEQEQQQQQQLHLPPHSQRRAFSSSPSSPASQSPLVLPAPSLACADGRTTASASGPPSSSTTTAGVAAVLARPKSSSHGYSSDGGDDGDADTSEDDFDDTILWSPEEQRRRETRFREKIARLRRTLRDKTQEATLVRRQMERREVQHAAAIKEAHAATIAAQTALAAAKSAPQAAPVSTRLEALLRDADRKLAAQSTELKSVQTALVNARTLHARELELLRSKLMQSAAESAAFAAYKKSSVMYVSSLRGANEAQLVQLQSLGSRLDAAESSLRIATERHAASKARHRLRVTALAEHLEQANASLHALQGRHQNVVEQARQLQAELGASEAGVAQLAETLRQERAQHAQLRSDLSSFSTRAGLRVGLELVAVLREVALAREDLANVRQRRTEEEDRIAAMQAQQQEVDSLRAAHASLLQHEAAQRASLESLGREHATLLDLLLAEVEGKVRGGDALDTAVAVAAAAADGSQRPPGCASASATMPAPVHAASPRFIDQVSSAEWTSPDGPQREGAAASAGTVTAHPRAAPATLRSMHMPVPLALPLHFDAAVADNDDDASSAHQTAAASAAMAPTASWSQLSLSLAAARQQANGPPAPSPFLNLPLSLSHAS